ncbi:Nn.00g058450.m01.CDS01 [Neocucurbitaria sp. VM-36]
MLKQTPAAVLDTRVPYRVGSPMLPVQPLDTLPRQWFAEWSEPTFRQDMNRILREEKVHVEKLQVVKRVQKGKDVGVTPKTIMVISDIPLHSQYDRWKEAVVRLRALLVSIKRYDVAVLDTKGKD